MQKNVTMKEAVKLGLINKRSFSKKAKKKQNEELKAPLYMTDILGKWS